MKAINELSALFYDNGLFIPLARKLGKSFKKVYYCSPWMKGFSIINDAIIGDGFDEIERIDDPWDVINKIDLAVFPDIQNAGMQLQIESLGIPVWGARRGDDLEIKREFFHKTLGKLGLDVANYVVCVGMTELRQHLKDKENKFIKISKFRGSLETYHWRSWEEDEGVLDLWAVDFGPAKEVIRFLVFDAIETDLEIGGDTFCIDGQWPEFMLHGLEFKDKGYLGTVTKRQDMPSQIKDVLDAFSPVLKDYRYRSFWSMELRIQGNKAYFIDPTARGGLPSINSQMELWENLPDIIWQGANGILVDPFQMANFSIECVLTQKSEKQAWSTVIVPPQLEQWMKLGSCCKINDTICFPPDPFHGNEIGWLVATGDTIDETINKMKDYISDLPDGICANIESLVDILKEVEKEEQEGITFTDQKIPEPVSVIED